MVIIFLEEIADLEKEYSGLKRDFDSSAKNVILGEAGDPSFSHKIKNH